MIRRPPPRRTSREPAVALINVVFLMLIFFLVAGRLAPSPDPDLTLVRADAPAAPPPRDALVVLADGTLRLDGRTIDDPAEALEADRRVRVMPDRALPAERLAALAARLGALGATEVVIVTEDARP